MFSGFHNQAKELEGYKDYCSVPIPTGSGPRKKAITGGSKEREKNWISGAVVNPFFFVFAEILFVGRKPKFLDFSSKFLWGGSHSMHDSRICFIRIECIYQSKSEKQAIDSQNARKTRKRAHCV